MSCLALDKINGSNEKEKQKTGRKKENDNTIFQLVFFELRERIPKTQPLKAKKVIKKIEGQEHDYKIPW